MSYTNVVKLDKHGPAFLAETSAHPEVLQYMPWGPWIDLNALGKSIDSNMTSDPGKFMFAIHASPEVPDRHGAKASNGEERFAGTLALTNCDKTNACGEVGWVSIPTFRTRTSSMLTEEITISEDWQRTCVNTHAVGLLLQYMLDREPPHGNGLGLQRAQWQCHADNAPSRRAAERLGFQFEGILRWNRVVAGGHPGPKLDGIGRMYGTERSRRHSCILSICWDDWENGGKEKVQSLIAR